MATKDVLIDVPILPTLAENKNKENVDPPGFLTIEDAYLDREGALRKRDGAVEDELLVVDRVTTPSFVASYNDDTVVGTSDGVYQWAPGRSAYNNTPNGNYDAVVDHKILSGLSSVTGEVDSWLEGSYLFVVFTIRPYQFNAAPGNPNAMYYVVYDSLSGEMVRAPFPVASGTNIKSPRVVFNGTDVSFWWIDGTTPSYTVGKTASIAAGANPGAFTTVSLAPANATDISWCRVPTVVGGVEVFTIFQGVVSVYSPTPSLALFSVGPTRNLPSLGFPQHRYVACKYIDATTTGGVDCVYVCSYEVDASQTSDLGKFTVSRLNVPTISWVGTERASVLLCSPSDTLSPTERNVAATQYLPALSRLVLGFTNAPNNVPTLLVWGTCYYTSFPSTPDRGHGACTTIAPLEIDPNSITSSIGIEKPIYSYAIASHAFGVTGRNSESVALVRSGSSSTSSFPNPPPSTSGITYDLVYVEGFASAIACVCADESPTNLINAYPRPIFTAFNNRVPSTRPNETLRFSLARGYVSSDVVTLVMKTQNEGGQTAFFDGNIELCAINMAPEASPTIEENSILIGRNMSVYFDGAYTSEPTPFDLPFGNSNVNGLPNRTDKNPQNQGAINDSQLVFVYSWEDSAGNVHRSGPSLPSNPSEVNVGPFTDPVYSYVWDYPLSIGTFPATSRVDVRRIELYVNELGVFTQRASIDLFGARAGRIATSPHLLFVNPVNWSISSPSTNATLYTEGGVLESQSPPSFKDVESGKGRLWGLTDNKLFYTKPIEERVAPEWNYALTLDIPDDTGITTGIGSMDDKVVAFTERGTYVVYGDGPNALGTGGTFAQLLRIPGNIGCIARGSIVECPLGIAFLSQQGFYLLDRGLNLTFIGKPVESSVDALIRLGLPHTIVSAVHDIGNKHVRFIVDSSMPGIGDMKRDHYIWYYESNQWGRFTSFNELQSVYSRGRVVSLFDRGVNLMTGQRTIQTTIEQDETSEYGTFVAPLKMKARTGWIDLGNIDGFERVKRFNFLYSPGFDPFNPNTTRQGINVRLYSQFRTTPADSTHAWDQSDLVTMQAPIDYAGEFSVQPKIQKCASMSIEFEEIENLVAPLTYQGTEVAGLTMRIGKRAGVSKMNIARARRK